MVPIPDLPKQIIGEFSRYSEEKNYCPLCVALYIRRFIEKDIYFRLADENLQENFLKEMTTIDRINFAGENNVDVPFEYYVLSPIYNDLMHINGKRMHKITTIKHKLDSEGMRGVIKFVCRVDGV